MRDNSIPLCAAAAIAGGFGLGWFARKYVSTSAAAAARRDGSKDTKNSSVTGDGITSIISRLCECGFDLTGKSSRHEQQHRSGRQHRVNMYRAGKPILVTAKVNEYRAAIATHVLPTDVVLEVGCAEGLTTQRLAQRAKVAIGIDQLEMLIDKGRARLERDEKTRKNGESTVSVPSDGWSNLHLHAADAFDKQALIKIVDNVLGISGDNPETDGRNANDPGEDAKAKKLTRKQKRELRQESSGNEPTERKHAGKVTKIWLDISGSRELRTVVHMINILEALFQPDLMVVKSDHLKNLVRRSYLPSSFIPGLTQPPNDACYVIS
eukprot:CAMPEP_0195529924 /NCGR_PEP_ID=MMETSP0794_2-20130614/32590_1 /TAXON_ID=515487 /ORGANISM="Stephanopyxis turris, Strain CCMP 815" /LENGTH=322 /DNA_ID=CAMNT_0040661305 /DNA_START=127 /DNA_END=1095 /DNA_ORIENTATION=+